MFEVFLLLLLINSLGGLGVAHYASARGFSWFGAFFLSLLITPVFSLLVYVRRSHVDEETPEPRRRAWEPDRSLEPISGTTLLVCFIAVIALIVFIRMDLTSIPAPGTQPLPERLADFVTLRHAVAVQTPNGTRVIPSGTRLKLLSARTDRLQVEHAGDVAEIPTASAILRAAESEPAGERTSATPVRLRGRIFASNAAGAHLVACRREGGDGAYGQVIGDVFVRGVGKQPVGALIDVQAVEVGIEQGFRSISGGEYHGTYRAYRVTQINRR